MIHQRWLFALRQIPPQKRNNTLAYYLAYAAAGAIIASFGPTLPTLADQVGVSLGDISFVFIAAAFGAMFGAVAMGRLFDHHQGHPLLALNVLTLATVFFFVPFAPSLAVLAVMFFCMGFAFSGIDVGNNSLLAWVHGPATPPFLNGLYLMFGVGAFISPLIIALVFAVNLPAASVFFIVAMLLLPIALYIGRLPSPQINPKDPTANTNARHSLDLILMGLLVLFFMTFAAAEAAFADWLFTYATETGLADKVTAAYMNSVYWGAHNVGGLLAIPLAMRFAPGQILLGYLLGVLASMALILGFQTPAALWLSLVGFGFFIAPVFANGVSFGERNLELTAKLTGWFFVGASVGSVVFPFIIGRAVEQHGVRVIMWLVATDLTLALAIVVLMVLHRNRRRG